MTTNGHKRFGTIEQLHDSRDARDRVDPTRLEVENKILRRRLELLTGSPGWRLNRGYRRWLRNSSLGRALSRPLAWLLKRVSGPSGAAHGKEPLSGTDYHAGIINESILYESMSGGDIVIVCEFPAKLARVPLVGNTRISGWAVAKQGIASVTASLDGDQEIAIDFGRRRPDIGMHLPDYRGSSDAGFLIDLDCAKYARGDHQLSILVRTTDQAQTTFKRSIRIEHGSPYSVWIQYHEAQSKKNKNTTRELSGAAANSTILIVMELNAFRPQVLRAQIDSVFKQTHTNWELCLRLPATAGDEAKATVESYAKQDARVSIDFSNPTQVSASHCVEAIRHSNCGLLAFVSDSTLDPSALSEVTLAFDRNRSLAVAYADEDRVLDDGTREVPFFKPNYSPELLRGFNYIGNFFVARRDVVEELANVQDSPDADPIYDLILRLSEITSNVERVAKVLSHRVGRDDGWLPNPASTNGRPSAARRAIEAHFERTATSASVEAVAPSSFHVRYLLDSNPEVLIVIPSAGRDGRLKVALESVLQKTEYSNFKILVADNSDGHEVTELVSSLAADDRVTLRDFRFTPFNFSRLCNQAAGGSSSPILLFLNDDVEVITPTWLGSMVEHANRKEIGAVGARLRFPDGTLQHAGVVIGIGGLVGSAFRGSLDGDNGHVDLSATTRNCAAVSAACLMTRRSVFEELNGFDEVNLQISLQDVDYCLRALEKGYRTVYDPHAELTHYESASREQAGLLTHPEEDHYFRERWADWIKDDPYYNPNLTRSQDNFAIRLTT